MKASQKTVLVLAVLIIILFVIQYIRSGGWSPNGAPAASAPATAQSQPAVSQAQLDAFRAQALAASKPAATSTLQLMEKYRIQAQQKYASSTYNPSAVKPTSI